MNNKTNILILLILATREVGAALGALETLCMIRFVERLYHRGIFNREFAACTIMLFAFGWFVWFMASWMISKKIIFINKMLVY